METTEIIQKFNLFDIKIKRIYIIQREHQEESTQERLRKKARPDQPEKKQLSNQLLQLIDQPQIE